MKVTYYGHSCFGVEISGKKLLFDPFISPNELAAHIDVDAIDADFILLSHGHEDHVADAVSIAKRTGAKVVAAYEIIGWMAKQGVENGQPLNHGGQWKFDFGTVKFVSAIHSSVLPDGTYGGNPGGFVVTSAEGNFYFAGDTALTVDMQLIPTYAELDFAMLPIGDCFTMGIDDAVIASEFIDCDNIIGMHFDTFGFIKTDHEEALNKFEEADKTLTLMGIGETADFD